MEPRSGGGWLRVGGRVVGSRIHDFLFGRLVGARSSHPRRVVSEWAPDLSRSFPPFPIQPEVSMDLPPKAFSSMRAPFPRGWGGDPYAHAQKEPRARGCGRSGEEATVSLLRSPLLFVEGWTNTPPILGGGRKEGNLNGQHQVPREI